MKKIFSISIIAIAALLLWSCSDSFLEVENPTGEPLQDYFTTDEHIQEALVAAYDPLHWPDWGLDQYNALNIDAEIMGEDFWVGGANSSDMENWHMLFNFSANDSNTLSSLWTVDYSGIKRCNDVLKYLDWGTDLTEENYASYEMQARCLRVFYYNMLWHYFGNIPFYLENLTAPYTAPQYTADQVYDEIVVELEAVLESGALPMEWDDQNAGRVSQAMAYMLYAEMVLYQNDTDRFSKALGYMQEIINSGNYALVDDYDSMWLTSGECGDESIWEINYAACISERGWSSPLAIGGTVLPTLISPNSWQGGDGWSKGSDGWGFLPIKVETYDMFDEADIRRDATCWDVRYCQDTDSDYTARYQDTHIWLKKYRPYDGNNNSGWDNNLNYDNNLRYYRYAETLLNAAELAIRTGNASSATAWVNLVRNRAGLASLSSVTVDDVLNERHLEFVGEGKRYWDLVRAEGISEASSQHKATSVLVPDSYGYRTNSWTAQKKYIPIALTELDTDPDLVQNNY